MSGSAVDVVSTPTSQRAPSVPGRTVRLGARGSSFVRLSDAAVGRASVVLLHGLGATADLNWSATFPALGRSFRVAAPDLRGHGDGAMRGPFTLEAAADDIAALADALSLGPIIIVGYSMGGAIAQLVCHRHPELVRGVVLCATSESFKFSWRERLLFGAVPSVRVAARAVPDDVARATARLVVDRLTGEIPERRYARHLRILDVDNMLEAVSALGGYCSHSWIGTVAVPSAVVVHLRDQLVPPCRQFALAHALPGAVVYPVDGDHFAAVKKPSVFVSTLTRAVRDVDCRASQAESRLVKTPVAS